MTQQNLAARAATKSLEAISNGLWDLKANLMSDIVDQHGPATSLAWFARNMPPYEKILKRWGPLRTHYVAVTISALNGCAYCTYGHAYAFVLHFFDQRGELFSLTEEQLRDCDQLDRPDVVTLLRTALVDSDMRDQLPWFERTIELLDATQAAKEAGPSAAVPAPTDQDGKWIMHLIEMFAFLNSCGIAADTEPDAAHDPVNKDIDLRDRYAAARAR